MRFLRSTQIYNPDHWRRWCPKLESLESRDMPSILAVTTTGDSGAGTLRDAISRAAAGDQIVFSLPNHSTIQLTSGPLTSNNNLTIHGPGQAALTIRGNGTFNVIQDMKGALSLSGLTITNGTTGVFTSTLGQTSVTQCTITGSNSSGLDNGGSLVLNDCLVAQNSSIFGNGGGLVVGVGASAALFNCTVINNSAINGAPSSGGGIYNAGNLTLTNTTVESNRVGEDTMNGGDQGGGIYNGSQGVLVVLNSSIINNLAQGNQAQGGTDGANDTAIGGGIYNNGGTLTIVGSTIANNTAEGGSSELGNGGNAQGGGIFSLSDTATFVNCTLVGNAAVGGTSFQATNGSAFGGGASLFNSTMPVLGCTIAGNSVTGTATSSGGGLDGAAFELLNTIVAGNSAPIEPDIHTRLGIETVDHSLIGVWINQFFTPGSGNQIGTTAAPINPHLGALANNGGATRTMALLSGSPAINAGSNAWVTAATDERGLPRIVGASVDIGAFEVQEPNVTVHLIAVGAGYGMAPEVKVYDPATGKLKMDFLAYSAFFTGGVRVAVADINGDGVPDIITAPAGVKVTLVNVNGALLPQFNLSAGRAPEIKVFSGVDGSKIEDFVAYPSTFTAGVFVAAGDVNGDGKADIITAPDATGQSGHTNVRVFLNGGLVNTGAILVPSREFNAYAPGFGGGVRIALGDINGDGFTDIITAPGIWSGPDVRIFNGQSIALGSPPGLIGEFLAYDSHYFGGVYVAAGDVNGDGRTDVITGTNGNGGPEVKAFSGFTIGIATPPPQVLDDFFAYDPAFGGGSAVAVTDVNGDGRSDIVTGAGPGGGPHVRIFDGLTGLPLNDAQDSFYAFSPSFSGGVFIGGV
jgi:hypothetical protein